MFALKTTIGQKWGTNPHLMRWAYTGIVRPKLTYGCHIWSHKVNKTLGDKLTRLNRLACICIAPVKKYPKSVQDTFKILLMAKSAGYNIPLKSYCWSRNNLWSDTVGPFCSKNGIIDVLKNPIPSTQYMGWNRTQTRQNWAPKSA